MATVYNINKGVNRSIEFKGIKAQYIAYLAAGLVILLLLFAVLYAIKTPLFICLAFVLSAGGGLILYVQRFSKRYGEHGLLKRSAKRYLPTAVTSFSRKYFIGLKKDPDAQE